MFSKDKEKIVDGFRHQNFWIWAIFAWVMAVLVKIIQKIPPNAVFGVIKLFFN